MKSENNTKETSESKYLEIEEKHDILLKEAVERLQEAYKKLNPNKDGFDTFYATERNKVEVDKLINVPIIKEQIKLSESNAQKRKATELLKHYIELIGKTSEFEFIEIKWSKNDGYKIFDIKYEKS